ncbi:methyl-accepting chemotaxis protein [Pseudomonas sp. CFBP 13711]|uniref:methyl-accepting chemotaxis protein n=1 Tax=Pseudomonas sp. CFBP 13711 TaxID=2775310 RepID=UPI001781F258|nr:MULTISPECIES: methyl-accepting chemotaxis protein [unclassified Pseudomonas]MBD8709618.1 methyl-accepting chemotaxis protein [Pseudomonas sp. CFBP 13711]MBD8714654.1 methyl-accepting chemotaxis protein [Pseudomonas sp. CFBP 13715]
MLKTIKSRYAASFIGFVLLIGVCTALGVNTFITPDLTQSDERQLVAEADQLGELIKAELAKVQAQQRVITETVPLLESNNIDMLLPSMINQDGEIKVFGGGIWPLPEKRVTGRMKASTFYHRDSSGKLVLNSHWNLPESPNYFDQPWYTGGMNSPVGQCAWAAAYKDDASPQPRTNCAMVIKKDNATYGVSTIDVTLGFFDELVANKEREINAELMIVERDGKILSNQPEIPGNNVLKNVSDLAGQYPFAEALRKLLHRQTIDSQYEDVYTGKNGIEYKLFLSPIEGTPWVMAVAQSTDVLNAQSHKILKALAWLQIPVLLLMLIIIVIALGQLMKRLNTLTSNIDVLSSGEADLTKRIHVDGHDEVDKIGSSVNNFVSYLQTLISDVSLSSSAIANGVSELQGRTLETRMILDRHVNETNQAVTAITEMSSTAEDVARNAADTASLTRVANDQALSSKKIVEDASLSVHELISEVDQATHKVRTMEQDARRINSVLMVIGEIAGQTNLLALNAAIEAARAGEQGRGFAVVADEVRALAGRTQASTSEINEMLSRLQEGVSAAVLAMEATKEKCQSTVEKTALVTDGLDVMADSVSRINDFSTQIATAAEEQSAVSDEINRNMVTVRQIVNDLVSGASASEQNSQSLTNSNKSLIGLVKRFKV